MEGDDGGNAAYLHAGVVGILAGAGGHRSDDAAGSFDLTATSIRAALLH
jgi:hypothetical protein